jgi:hypothetical protein
MLCEIAGVHYDLCYLLLLLAVLLVLIARRSVVPA